MKNKRYIYVMGIILTSYMMYTTSISHTYSYQPHPKKVETIMMQLYCYDFCPYCKKVLNFIQEHNLMQHFEIIDAGQTEFRKQLEEISGRTQAPYLVDASNNVSMPESDDIIAYIKSTLL